MAIEWSRRPFLCSCGSPFFELESDQAECNQHCLIISCRKCSAPFYLNIAVPVITRMAIRENAGEKELVAVIGQATGVM